MRKDVERRVTDLTVQKTTYQKDLAGLKEKVAKYETSLVESKVKGVEVVRAAVDEATEGVEFLLEQERKKYAAQRRAQNERHTMQLRNEVAAREDDTRRELAIDKAVALAEQVKIHGEEMHKYKFQVEDKWRRKFEKLQQHHAAAKQATARDVKQLTALHSNHVKALEKSLREETSRLEKARAQVKHLTITRATESAKNANDRETEWQSAAQNQAEIAQLRLMLERMAKQRDEAERLAEAASSKAKRTGDDSRLESAKVQGIRSRLSEAEAECILLRRENEELKAYKAGGEIVRGTKRRAEKVHLCT